MSKFMRNVKIFALAAGFCATSQAAVLTFDDLSGDAFFTSNYNGIGFGSNSGQTNTWFYSDDTTVFYTANSPTHYIATSLDTGRYTGAQSEESEGITSANDFVFQGANFAGGSPNGIDVDTIFYRLYNNGVLVHTSSSINLSDTYQFLTSGYGGLIDEVRIVGRQGYYTLDDFTVPEPGSYSLVLAGLLAAAVVRRKRSK